MNGFRSLMKRKWLSIPIIIVLVIMLLYGGIVWFASWRYYGTPSTEVWLENQEYDEKNVQDLIVQEGKGLKILVLSDIQLETDPRKDFRTIKFVKDIVEKTKPDVLFTTGDNASWYFADLETKRLIKVIEQLGIPWGVTLGNHDSEGRGDRVFTGNLYENAKNSLFRSGPSNIHGVGNYSVNIKDTQGNVIYELIMMDSNVKRTYPNLDYVDDFIYYDQIKWYEWVVKGVSKSRYGEYNPKEGKVVPSMLFFHIPIAEFREAEEAVENREIKAPDFFGENRSGKWAVPVNTGLFEAVQNVDSTTHIFCGHDHRNSLSALYKGVWLTYGLKAGYSAHYDLDMVGGTIIRIQNRDSDVTVDVEHFYMREE